MAQMPKDREYAISFEGRNGLEEIGTDAITLWAAQKFARVYIKDGAKNVTIKYYEDYDLRHQWDYKEGKWVRYE